MDAAVIVAVVAAVPGVAGAVFAARASSRANQIALRASMLDERKVDAQAYKDAQEIYERALAQLRGQIDRLSEQLAQEQDVSNTLRNQVRTLQQTMLQMEQAQQAMRLQLVAAGITPPVPAES